MSTNTCGAPVGEMSPRDDQNLWNFLFSVLFLALLALSLREIHALWGYFPQSLPVFDAILIALAIFRLIRLFVYDKITQFFRDLFVMKKVVSKTDGVTFIERVQYKSGPLRTISDLLGCPWCLGVWAGLAIVSAYFLVSWSWYVILILALSGVGSFIQLVSNMVGWRAENLKLDAKSR